MPHILTNQSLSLHLDLPSEGYRNARFDWTGKITKVIWNDILFTGIEKSDNSDEHLFGKGLYNEFGIDTALGFEEVEIGDWFHKIGIGLLKKTDHQYLFSHAYEIKPAKFEVEAEANKLIIHCRCDSYNGYAYLLSKEFEVQDNSFSISYRLENQGEKVIQTSEYVHNFMAIKDEPIGPDYMLRFPFQIRSDTFAETVNPEQAVEIGHDRIGFHKIPTEPFFFSKLGGNTSVDPEWNLISRSHQVGIREKGNFPCKQVNLWGCGHVISPELFVELCILPGETKTWVRSYDVFQVE